MAPSLRIGQIHSSLWCTSQVVNKLKCGILVNGAFRMRIFNFKPRYHLCIICSSGTDLIQVNVAEVGDDVATPLPQVHRARHRLVRRDDVRRIIHGSHPLVDVGEVWSRGDAN